MKLFHPFFKTIHLITFLPTLLITSLPSFGYPESIDHIKIVTYDATYNYTDLSLGVITKRILEPLGIIVEDHVRPILSAYNIFASDDSYDAFVGDYKVDWPGIIYPSWPIYSGGISAVFRKDNSYPWQATQTLAHQRLGWVNGYFLYPWLGLKFSEINVQKVNHFSQCINMLEAKRVDYCLEESEYVIPNNLKDMGLVGRYRIEPVFQKSVFPLFKDNPRGRKLIKNYDKRMWDMHRSGELLEIFTAWGIPGAVPKNPIHFPELIDKQTRRIIAEFGDQIPEFTWGQSDKDEKSR
ncbi:MAG: transporter substrate-binding domain-containing protein [Magnetococcales bacterium]|nr:transporter substrate-binding domain-containing protein [Magnetococcales bacterium]